MSFFSKLLVNAIIIVSNKVKQSLRLPHRYAPRNDGFEWIFTCWQSRKNVGCGRMLYLEEKC